MKNPILLMGNLVRRLMFLALFALFPLHAFSAEVRAIGVATLSDGAVAIVIDATGSAQVTASALRSPDRLVLDLQGIPYRAEAQEGAGKGFVERYRMGDDGAKDISSTRIVLDLNAPALAESIEMVPGASGTRMIVRLVKVAKADFASAASQTVAEEIVTTGSIEDDAPQGDTTGLGLSSPAAAPSDGKDGIAGQPFADRSDGRMVIVLDPGHGGIDPGAVASRNVVEKDIVLLFANSLKQELEKDSRYKVVLTRDGDAFISLDDRVKIARENQAALMISIHADTLMDEPGVRGATVYTLADKASDARSARLAEKENAVDALAGNASSGADAEVSDILFDLTRRETRVFSTRFAQSLIWHLGTSLKINKNPKRFARFRVLTAPDVPSILLELGYLSSDEDAKLVSSDDWRNQAAQSVTQAINDFAQNRLAQSSAP